MNNPSLTKREKYLIWAMFLFLLCSGMFHIFMQDLASEILANQNVIRLIGFSITILGILHLLVKRRYFRVVGTLYTLHGLWRLLIPASSIAVQEGTYPRWVHGIIILTAAVVFTVLPYKLYKQGSSNT